MAKNHPGFKAVQAKIAAKQGVSQAEAGAMLAAGTRRAGAKARKKNPSLNKVKGKAKPASQARSSATYTKGARGR